MNRGPSDPEPDDIPNAFIFIIFIVQFHKKSLREASKIFQRKFGMSVFAAKIGVKWRSAQM